MKSEVSTSIAVTRIMVTEDMTASLDGNEIHKVYSTFWLSYHAEVTARKAIEPYFDEGENAVGGALSIKHIAMTPVGASVSITAEVTEIINNKVICQIRAVWDDKLIAVGSQTQIIDTKEHLNSLVEQAYLELKTKQIQP
jgi:fluoroacetyl-CoA thioesterase